jgi:hypothetical protein
VHDATFDDHAAEWVRPVADDNFDAAQAQASMQNAIV